MEQTSYGGFWIRLIAFLIDGFILAVPFIIYTYIQFGTYEYRSITSVNFLYGITGLLYYVILPTTPLQATFGKAILGMKITSTDGERISVLRSLGRYISQFISGLIFLFGFIMIAFMKRKEGLHDLLAKTYVVKK
ncbi:RDD family protein [Paenalkalicoccus suaedae]|uniref:RDD family protein n=1 Tax=Paenalkalicoccus suaedae TaxID=2592382 RepID=A0A859FCD4_9BACI|nr:RDD family protein [Paenalkalicoccus suaedae]QKS69925.1 RDD family protein [Paenalkalicoccus suaedae]